MGERVNWIGGGFKVGIGVWCGGVYGVKTDCGERENGWYV